VLYRHLTPHSAIPFQDLTYRSTGLWSYAEWMNHTKQADRDRTEEFTMAATSSWEFLRIPNADGTFSIYKADQILSGSFRPTPFTIVGPSCPPEPPANMTDEELQRWLNDLRNSGYEIKGL
jgi:hypothetical protein